MSDDSHMVRILQGLNENQNKAVCAPNDGQVQIIAGPGTGKTKVLTSRVAYLLLKEKVQPEHIIVTTFTKKAANEMVERMYAMLSGTSIDLSKLIIGTFHSICFRFLKIYGHLAGFSDFKIAEDRDSTQIVHKLLDESVPELEDYKKLKSIQDQGYKDPTHQQVSLKNDNPNNKRFNGYDPKKVKRQISKLKSSAVTPAAYSALPKYNKELAILYRYYQTRLKEANLIDFDDCLLNCQLLLSKINCVNFVKHVLVDEFQDTNSIQLKLMNLFAQSKQNVTIVGDPDQSIYGFRDAMAINFDKMLDMYPSCLKITLTENYRSTSDVLKVSELIMRQQSDRNIKNLTSQETHSFPPVFNKLTSNIKEAEYIAQQINYLLQLPNLFNCSNIAILVRASYQTRVIEHELVKMKLPYVIVRGKAFWDRKEVIAIIDYLRVVSSDKDRVAIVRTLNYPKRSIGPKTIDLIEELFNDLQSPMETLEDIIERKHSKFTEKQCNSVRLYVDFIKGARAILDSATTPDALSSLFDFIYAKSDLQKEYREDPNQELNIMEVKSQLMEFEPIDETLPLFEGASQSTMAEDTRNLLEKFISSVDLYESDAKTQQSENIGKICISTIHASKGLEWPVVFVPGLSESLLPASFAMNNDESINEERRCFYVATTRSKLLLYLTCYVEKQQAVSYRRIVDQVSRFISTVTRLIKPKQGAFLNLKNIEILYGLNNSIFPKGENFAEFISFYNSGKMIPPGTVLGSSKTVSSKTDFSSSFTTARIMNEEKPGTAFKSKTTSSVKATQSKAAANLASIINEEKPGTFKRKTTSSVKATQSKAAANLASIITSIGSSTQTSGSDTTAPAKKTRSVKRRKYS